MIDLLKNEVFDLIEGLNSIEDVHKLPVMGKVQDTWNIIDF